MQSELVTDVPRFSLAERDSRWARVRALMRQEKLDVIFVPPNTGMWGYVSGERPLFDGDRRQLRPSRGDIPAGRRCHRSDQPRH